MEFSPYLFFSGNCAEALKAYEQIFGATIESISTYGDSPMADQAPAGWNDKIMHASMKVGDQRLMASDAPPGQYSTPQGLSVAIGLKDAAEGERVFKALAENGTVQLEFQKTFWAAGFGMCIDRFGIPWMVNCE
jgi:PhnB protein